MVISGGPCWPLRQSHLPDRHPPGFSASGPDTRLPIPAGPVPPAPVWPSPVRPPPDARPDIDSRRRDVGDPRRDIDRRRHHDRRGHDDGRRHNDRWDRTGGATTTDGSATPMPTLQHQAFASCGIATMPAIARPRTAATEASRFVFNISTFCSPAEAQYRRRVFHTYVRIVSPHSAAADCSTTPSSLSRGATSLPNRAMLAFAS